MNHQAIITDGCDSLARSTSFKAALMAILLVKQLTIDLPEGDNNIWIILQNNDVVLYTFKFMV